jgi:hypothetical protein
VEVNVDLAEIKIDLAEVAVDPAEPVGMRRQATDIPRERNDRLGHLFLSS